MNKKTVSLFALALYLNFLVDCSLVKNKGPEKIQTAPPTTVAATKFPEITMTFLQQTVMERKGKILGLNGTRVKFLPAPYWSESPLEVEIDNIYSLRRTEHSYLVSTLPLFSFFWGYAGGHAAAINVTRSLYTYKEDLEQVRPSLNDTIPISLVSGLILAAITAVIPGVLKPRTLDIFSLSRYEKILTIKKLMGIGD